MTHALVCMLVMGVCFFRTSYPIHRSFDLPPLLHNINPEARLGRSTWKTATCLPLTARNELLVFVVDCWNLIIMT